MNTRSVSLLIAGFASVASQLSVPFSGLGVAWADKIVVLDVACDGDTIGVNPIGTDPDIISRGDMFIISGKIYPGGTIPAGGTFEHPSDFGPDHAGSIGNWDCYGTQLVSDNPAPVNSTQRYILNSGKELQSNGFETDAATVRAVLGGTGDCGGVRGQVKEEPIGINSTHCANLRFTFQLKDVPARCKLP